MTHSNYTILIADIGGTNARFAFATADGRSFEQAQTLECAEFKNMEAAVDTYLHSHGVTSVDAICLAVAGPIIDESVTFPNNHWKISCESLRSRYHTQHVHLLNDWEAIAYSLPIIPASERLILGTLEQPEVFNREHFTLAAIGPGSGLGVAGLCGRSGQQFPLVTEGGHVGFSPESSEQVQILEYLHTKFDDRVSRERFLSGPGLVNIHEALCALNGSENPGLIAADIAVAGIARTDPICAKTMDLFFEILGQVAGDVALSMGAFDGVFIGGGIAQRYPKQLLESNFRRGFENKGRHSKIMRSIPTSLITHKNPGLLGASVFSYHLMNIAAEKGTDS